VIELAKAEWGADPEFFGPRHAHREGRILRAVEQAQAGAGPHLECAAGVGSLSRAIAATGRAVVAADRSLRSLLVLRHTCGSNIRLVVADITALPFPDKSFVSVTSAETLEHIDDDGAAVAEFCRLLRDGGALCGTVPAGPGQWSDWDDWADHRRRYTKSGMAAMLADNGLQARVTTWGWPLMRLYDGLFLRRVNRRRHLGSASVNDDPGLRRVASLGQRRWLVRLVAALFSIDRLFDGLPWGIGLLFSARKCGEVSQSKYAAK